MDKSYFLFAQSGNEILQGTGFLLEKNSTLFLVTAAHNFHTDKTAIEKKVDAFYIRLHDYYNKPYFMLIQNNPVDKPEEYKLLDINFYKIEIPVGYKKNIIDILPKRTIEIKEIYCYGFAVNIKNIDSNNLIVYLEQLLPTLFYGLHTRDYNKPLVYDNGEIDYQNYVVRYVSETLIKGSSGSPVFAKGKVNEKETYEFAGLIHTGNEIYKNATIIRKEVIQELFEKI